MQEHEIPKQYDPADAQERWTQYWEDHKIFQPDALPTGGRQNSQAGGTSKKPFCIVIPPPNVTGALHMGHALNNTLQDITIRMKRMQGFDTVWIPGVDHAGIATQAVVERKLFEEEKKTRHDIGREALIQRIWDWKEQYQTRIIQQLKAMGCSCDWGRTRFTLDEVCAKAVRHFFFKLFEQQKIYRGKRLVNWDTHLQTAVSDDEVFHEAIEGHFWYIRYELSDGNLETADAVRQTAEIVVATTRPETMLGDTAVAVHPDPESALDKAIEELKKRIATASEKDADELKAELESIERRKTDGTLAQLKFLADLAQSGGYVLLPLLNKRIPIIADTWAKPEKGTGCVKITPAHDPNDYEVGLRHRLPMVNILNKDGTLNENAGPYAGLTLKKAREQVVADLESGGFLVKTEDRVIELAHSDRSKTPIEPFLNDQWFVQMDDLAQSAIEAVSGGQQNRDSKAHWGEQQGKIGGDADTAESLCPTADCHTQNPVRIYPARYTKGYVDWLSEKRDWPIGRQLWWGHRIPIWYCEGATESELEKTFAGRSDVIWQWSRESNVWWICSQTEDLSPDAVPGYTLCQEEDVLDTWFSSALWPHSVLGWPEETPELAQYYPTGVLITNRDILTLWVARMVLAGLFNTGKKPFDEVYIHPKILDKYGEGMSKSKGNGIDPVSVIAKYGADALRFALAYLTTENQDIRLVLDFECPYCGAVCEQTKKNRILPKISCPKCKKDFRTQWAETSADKALPEGPMIGERFEVARNFCNKLWNAARFVFMNLPDTPDSVAVCRLSSALSTPPSAVSFLEDQWILSRLATVTREVTHALETYHYADAMRSVYDFAWDEFCSFYVEIVKSRLADESQRGQALSVLIYVLNALVRLLHPVIPFVTETIWQRLRSAGVLPECCAANPSIATAPFPMADDSAINLDVEKQFAVFQELLRAVRDVRASRNVPPKQEILFSVRCDEATAALLKPMEPYFLSMARSRATGWGLETQPPPLCSTVSMTGMDVFVDISDLIDVPAEIAKLEGEIAKLDGFIKAKESKLSGDFINKAPQAVVEKEQESLAGLQTQRAANQAAIERLHGNV